MDETTSTTERRSRWRRRISYGVAVALTTTIVVVLHHQSSLLPGRISTYVNSHYLAGTNFEFSVDGVSGFFIRHIKLKNPVLRYHSASASYNVFRADEISVEYDLMPIFAFRLIVTDLTLRNVAIHLRQDADGRLVLPVPPSKGKPGRFMNASPVVNVRRFKIDGLDMKFGGNKRQLAVRDVNLAGSFDYENRVGRLGVEEGRAYLIDSKKTVSSVRLEVRSDGDAVRLDDFAIRLDESFVLARGAFRDGYLRDVNLVFNPISLPELHQLGLIPDEKGTFTGRVALEGPVDSLRVGGEVTGAGLGVVLSAVGFDGVLTPRTLDLSRLHGSVFGSKVDGAFRVGIESGDFLFDGFCEDLDLGRGFIKDRELPPMSLTGRVWVDHTKRAERYAWQADLSRAVVDGFECSARGEGVWNEATGLSIERASLQRPGFKAGGSGTVSAKDVADIVFKVEGTDLTYFWDHFKLPRIGGAVALNGLLRGPIDDFQVNLNGPFQNLVFEPVQVDSGSVQAEARRLGTKVPEVSVSLSGRRGAIAGQWFDSPVVQVEVDTSHVEVRNARFERGDTSFVTDLDIKARGKNARIDVRRVVVTTPTDVWSSVQPSTLFASPGVLEVDSLVLACTRGELGVFGTVHQTSRTMDLNVWGRGINLAVVRDAAGLPFDLRGTGDFALGLTGSTDDPNLRLTMDVARGVVDSVAFDGLTAHASFDGRAYAIDDLLVVAGGDSVRARGAWQCDVSPRRFARRERPESMWSAPLSADLAFRHFPLSTVFTAMHRPSVVASAYDGTLSLGGTLESPTAKVRGSIVPARGQGHELPPMHLNIDYADGALQVTDASVTDVVDLHVSGTFPLVLSARHGARVASDQPLSFRLDLVPRKDAPSEVGRYVGGVSLLRGVMSGTVVGSGTPANPRLTGGLSLTRGELRVVGLQEDFREMAMRVDFIDDVVRLTSFSARSGKDGTIVGTGWARLSNYRPVDYKLDLTVHDFWLRSIPDVAVRTDGTASVRLARWRDGRTIPQISGKLNVREAEITTDLTSGAGGPKNEFTRPTDQPDWVASVDINAPKNVWFRNPDVTVEMEGDVILNRDEQGLYFRGDMSILRGSYLVYGNKFQITDGSFDFSASETLRPSMQISAYTPFYDSKTATEGNIYLSLTWPYDQKEPRIRLSSDTGGYSEAELWAILGQNNLGAGMATNVLQKTLDSQFSGVNVDVGRRTVHDPAGVSQETVVGLGKYVWEDIYLQYRRGLSIEGEQEVNVEYRLRNRLLLRSQVIYNSRTKNRSGLRGNRTDEYNLDLKYRFEF